MNPRFRANSTFSRGPRVPMGRIQRTAWLALCHEARRTGHVTALHVEVARALVRKLDATGKLDPSHAEMARSVGCCVHTVRRALTRLRDLGLLGWERRIVRVPGWRCAQISNAYEMLAPPGWVPPPRPRPAPKPLVVPPRECSRNLHVAGGAPAAAPFPPLLPDRGEALAALAAVAARRMEVLRRAVPSVRAAGAFRA